MDEHLVWEVYEYQYQSCYIYKSFCKNLNKTPDKINAINQIPYLPISAFKHYEVKCGKWQEEKVFTSSSTTGQIPSKHYVKDIDWYDAIAEKCFKQFYGDVSNYGFYALLPSYLERSGSSLIHMADHFLKKSKRGGFYLYNHEELVKDIQEDESSKILLGVSFALLDLAETFAVRLDNVTLMETGGMKGRKKEISRDQLHGLLKQAFKQESIHSEYGMTELMSQAYSEGGGIFYTPQTMQVNTVQLNDPLSKEEYGRSGMLRIIDLGNIDTCSFIQTDDMGVVHPDGSFEVLGRVDHSEIRGCNLMVSDF
ncbi:MAG: acyl transferase [Saprospiraceae bacterium]|nr:acyl transferase [Saprospiraceae bacterium]